MKVCVMGLGYIGLPAASLLATKGFQVHGVDVKSDVVKTISKGNIHIFEPDLDVLVKSAINSGNMTVSTSPTAADVFIICVPTPFKPGHLPDLDFVEAAAKAIAPFVAPGNLVLLESTSPVGTTERIVDWLTDKRPDLRPSTRGGARGDAAPVYFAHCPERVLPGYILKELVNNDRIVGGIDAASTEKACEFYRSFVNGEVLATDSRTAEMAKLVENSFRDVNIAFANELSIISDKLGIDVWKLIELANRHPRVKILQPGPGVGGHCIAVDPWFIVHSSPDEARLIRTAREVNDSKPHFVVNQVMEHAKKFKSATIACLGLSYKSDIDDLRESPAVEIVHAIAKRHPGTVLVVEPHIKTLPSSFVAQKNVSLAQGGEALAMADIVVLLVNHKAFLNIDQVLLAEKVIVDTRGIWR